MRQDDKPTAHALIDTLLRSAKDATMRSIYERIQPNENNVIRYSQNPGGTETGRFSHSETFLDPSTNLANLPKKTAALDGLYAVRDCIVPHEGRLLGKADYSQAEARWCAWLAGDEDRIRMHEEEIDPYRYVVAALEWDDPDRWPEVDKLKRDAIGKVNYLSGQYQVSWRTMQNSVNADADLHGIAIDAKTAKKMEALWPELFPRTVEWWSEVEDEVLSRGYLVNPFGRRRDFFGRQDSASARRSLVREAIAFLPQSSNADMLNTALRRIYAEHDPQLVRVLLQVHDEIIFDCAPRDLTLAARSVKNAMEFDVNVNGRSLRIPAEVEMSSKSWSETTEVAA